MSSHREGQAHIHAAGIARHWCVQEFPYLGKRYNLIELALCFSFLHSLAFKVHADRLRYNSQ